MGFNEFGPLVVAVLVPNAGSWIGDALIKVFMNETWYDSLEHPAWVPSIWMMTVLSILLYTVMGIASYLAWLQSGITKWGRQIPLMFYIVQLLLSWAWRPIFFLAQNILGTLLVIVLLWPIVLGTAVLFYFLDKSSGYLMTPHIIATTAALAMVTHYYLLNI